MHRVWWWNKFPKWNFLLTLCLCSDQTSTDGSMWAQIWRQDERTEWRVLTHLHLNHISYKKQNISIVPLSWLSTKLNPTLCQADLSMITTRFNFCTILALAWISSSACGVVITTAHSKREPVHLNTFIFINIMNKFSFFFSFHLNILLFHRLHRITYFHVNIGKLLCNILMTLMWIEHRKKNASPENTSLIN